MSKRMWLLLPALILTASCQSSVVPIDTACSWVKPIYTNKADRDVMADELAKQLAAHNRLYKSHCMK
jgi:hypothetical protein